MAGTTKTDHALERLVFFSDAVFAIAITLLVIEIRIPELPKGSSDVAHLHALKMLIPSFVGYVISFALVGLFWIGHHRAFALADRYSAKVLGSNMLLLGAIAFMPFATAYYTHNVNQRVPAMFYCGVLSLAALLNLLVVWTATGPNMASPHADAEELALARRRNVVVALGALTALAATAVSPKNGPLGLTTIILWDRLCRLRPLNRRGRTGTSQ